MSEIININCRQNTQKGINQKISSKIIESQTSTAVEPLLTKGINFSEAINQKGINQDRENWLSKKEVLELLNVSWVSVFKGIKAGKYLYKQVKGNGGLQYRIALSSLPAEAQTKWSEAFPKYSVNPFKTVKEAKSVKINNQKTAVLEALAVPAGFPSTKHIAAVADKYGLHRATLYRWIEKHTTPENKVVEHKDYKIDFSEFRKFSPEALEWAVGRRMSFPLETIDYTYKELARQADSRKWKIGSLKRFHVALSRIPRALIIAATEGARGLDNKIAPAIERDLSVYAPLDMVVGDQMIADYYVMDETTGEIFTPEFYVWLDMGTSYICGVTMTLGRYNKYDIGMSLKQVCNYGIPKCLYNDNGKPELSDYISSLACDLGIDTVNAKPRNSKAKPIEGVFAHLQRHLFNICEGMGYKKYDKSELDLLRQEQLKDAVKSCELMTIDVFATKLLESISWWNSHFNKRRKLVASEAFIKGLSANPKPQIAPEVLDYLFLPKKLYTVRNSAVHITINNTNLRFVSEKLALYQGQRIEVRYSPYDLDKVYLIDNGELIDTAQYRGKVDPTNTKDVAAALAEKDETVRRFEIQRRLYMQSFEGLIKKVTSQVKIVKAITKKEQAKETLAISDEERDKIIDSVLQIAN